MPYTHHIFASYFASKTHGPCLWWQNYGTLLRNKIHSTMTWCPRVDRPLELLFDLWIVDRPVESGFALIAIAPRQIRHIGEILHRVCRISGHRSIRMRNMLRRGCQPYSQGKQQADNGGQRDYGIHTPLPFLSPLTRLLTPPAGTSGFVATPIKQQWCIHEIPPHSVSVM